MKNLKYLSGFHNSFETEALQDALPKGQNSPQKVPYGLYAEQLSGSAFTSMRAENYRSWLYKIRPSVVQSHFRQVKSLVFAGTPWEGVVTPPDQMRWKPRPYSDKKTNFIESLFCMAGTGSRGQNGCAIYLYAFNESMTNEFFYSADGEFLIVPEEGALEVRTEMGVLHVAPLEIVVVPRGVKFQIRLLGASTDQKARGYVCENFGRPFELPYLGPIGANGLAHGRDFQTPVAAYEDLEGEFKLFAKFDGYLFEAEIGHSPLDIVAWHGNLAPYKYDLRKFNTINTVSYDHPDPSIFTVLTSPSNHVGTANLDFVIFPPRWMVAENTFRPPYFHRNFMNEFMGLIQGTYDAKNESFSPGGSSLHNRMTPHGPDADTFAKASNAVLKPEKIENTMAFMFETGEVLRLTKAALEAPFRELDYQSCWQTLPKNFVP